MKKLVGMSLAVVLTIFLAFGTGFAGDNSLPSSKAAVSIGNLTALGTASASTNNGASDDTGWVTVAMTYLKTPNKHDLAMDVALQCGLVTDTTVKSKGGDKDTSQAEGDVSVRVKVTNLRTDAESFAMPLESEADGVTYCSRLQRLEAKFAGLNCTADLDTGVVTCTDPEELRLLLETLSANAFNFLLANVEPGVQKIEVQARAQAAVELGGTQLGEAGAEAFVGLGSILVEQVRLLNLADTDGDGIVDSLDNCPEVPNPGQNPDACL